jgi:hypothetical protein
MKPALVLGLALAANAMVADSNDNNELFVAPTGSHAQKYQGKYIMYDEVADDELGIKYVHLPHPIPDVVAYDDDELVYARPLPVNFDEVADDELGVKIVHLPVAETMAYDDDELAVKYVHRPVPEVVAYDDDEFLAKKPREESKMTEAYKQAMGWKRGQQVKEAKEADDELAMTGGQYQNFPKHRSPVYSKYDEVADDELAMTGGQYQNFPKHRSPIYSKYDEVADDELAITPEQYQRIQNLGSIHARFDEVADDELAMTGGQYQNFPKHRSPIYSKYDEVADDELAITQQVVHFPEFVAYDDDELAITQQVVHFPEFVAYDDDELAYVPPVLADDELAITPEQYHRVQNLGSIHARFDEVADDELRIRPISVLPTAPEHVAFDDELSLMPIPPKFVNREWIKPVKMPATEALLRDDEADDELLYLGQLIKDGGYIPRPHFDDEFRAEKPSHMKAQERTQMKAELPKRKLRPVVNKPAVETPDYVI